jgi:hypothetical protein
MHIKYVFRLFFRPFQTVERTVMRGGESLRSNCSSCSVDALSLSRITLWVTCFSRFIHPYAVCSYTCARSTAQFSPLSCHQGNNSILATIISTCKRPYAASTLSHRLQQHVYIDLCLPLIIVVAQSIIIIIIKELRQFLTNFLSC